MTVKVDVLITSQGMNGEIMYVGGDWRVVAVKENGGAGEQVGHQMRFGS